MKLLRPQSGFTLIEMIVSLAIFGIVVTISVGALLVLVGTNQRLQGEQSVMTNLSFALDSMTREIRTGGAYWCFTYLNSNDFTESGNLDTLLSDTQVADCPSGHGNIPNNWRYHLLAFLEGGDSISSASGEDRILYVYDKVDQTIYRRVGTTKQAIVSDGVNITDVDFFVTGSEILNDVSSGTGETKQPTVTIYIRASENVDGSGKQFEVQTTVTQRTLDV